MKNSNYIIIEGLIYRKGIDRSRFVVSEAIMNTIIHTYHNKNVHYDVEKIVQGINKEYWFPSLR